MATCAVCQKACRGVCAKCGTRLCVDHKPKSTRAKCVICRQLGPAPVQNRRSRIAVASPASVPGTIATPYYTPPASLFDFHDLTPVELAEFLHTKVDWIREKLRREQSYRAYRASKGRFTSTDAALEKDAKESLELIQFLEQLERDFRAAP